MVHKTSRFEELDTCIPEKIYNITTACAYHKARSVCDVQDQRELAEHLRCVCAERGKCFLMHATVSVVLRFFALLPSGKVESMQVGGKCEQSQFLLLAVVLSRVVYVRFGMFRVHMRRCCPAMVQGTP